MILKLDCIITIFGTTIKISEDTSVSTLSVLSAVMRTFILMHGETQ